MKYLNISRRNRKDDNKNAILNMFPIFDIFGANFENNKVGFSRKVIIKQAQFLENKMVIRINQTQSSN